jgi:hypothetical protein
MPESHLSMRNAEARRWEIVFHTGDVIRTIERVPAIFPHIALKITPATRTLYFTLPPEKFLIPI